MRTSKIMYEFPNHILSLCVCVSFSEQNVVCISAHIFLVNHLNNLSVESKTYQARDMNRFQVKPFKRGRLWRAHSSIHNPAG